MIKIIQKENKILRKVSASVNIEDITGGEIQKIISEMQQTLDSQSDGVAIAAPQIAISLRIFIVSKRTFEIENKLKSNGDNLIKESGMSNLVFINPKIIKLSKKKYWVDEGCLSVRWLYGKTKRALNATVEAYDENGNKFTRGAGGLLAQIFQHEIDHLDGILFIDHAKDISEVLPDKL